MAEQNNDQAQVQLNDQAEAEQVQQDQELQKRLNWAQANNASVYNEITGNPELTHAEIVIMLDDASVPQAEDIEDTDADNTADDANSDQPQDQVDAGTTNDTGAATGESSAPDEPQTDAADTPAATQSIGTDPNAENSQGGSAIDADTDASEAQAQAEADQQAEDDRNRTAQETVGVQDADQKAPEDGAQTDGGTPVDDSATAPVADKPTSDEPDAPVAAVSQPEAETTATSTIDEPTDEKKDIQNADNTDPVPPASDDPTTQPAKDADESAAAETPSTDPAALGAGPTETVGTDPVAETSAHSIDGQPVQPAPGSEQVKDSTDNDVSVGGDDDNDTPADGDDVNTPAPAQDAPPADPSDPQSAPAGAKVDAPIEGASEAQANQPTPTDGSAPDEVTQKPQAKDKEPTEQPQTPGDQATGTSDGVNSLAAPEATDLVTSKTSKTSDPSATVALDTSAQANDFVKSDEDDVRNNTASTIPSPSDVLGDKANTSVPAEKQQGSIPVMRLNDTLDNYTTEMGHNKAQSDADGANLQRQLYRAIQNVIYTKDSADFVAGMNLLLDTIDEHSTGVFSERRAFRFWPHINLPQTERLEFENLMRLFVNLGPKDGRRESLKHTDLNAALQYTRDETVKERLHQYIKKITN